MEYYIKRLCAYYVRIDRSNRSYYTRQDLRHIFTINDYKKYDIDYSYRDYNNAYRYSKIRVLNGIAKIVNSLRAQN